ncbi:N-methylhydantoinase B [Granulicella pectinivorans]|uniref:N-methylhydantoinase B n=1 Tax=Granulicella pectinivorans TaxID=474950 RepID=A0A1I6LBB3_9BACT|nr:hydantoinase B/oxoprolinase family protein [Granulicella pectinivorans]SFS00772.1 N-methylhydantoinase B [Granulicella pectinivorans]
MKGFSSVTLEILWNRLLSVCNEQQVTLLRTAFSTVVRESQDLACGVFDARGQMIAQSMTGTPGHINAMATGVRHFLEAYPPETLADGDVLLTNDPWQTAGQINDMTVLTPVFREGSIVAYFASTCHAPDIGGRILSAEAREVYEEGLRIPITKLFAQGVVNAELIKLIRANVRTPEETVGDLYAQTSSNAVGARSLLHLMGEFGLESMEPLADEIIARSEAALRAAIEKIPNGIYEAETWSDGFEEPVRIKVTVTVKDRDIHIDFAGSSMQSRRGINVVLNYTQAYASFAIKAVVSPEVPHNDGSFRPVHVSAPLGSILNCREPAAVASRHLIGHFLPGVIFAALAPAMPGRLMAGGSEPVWISVLRGETAAGSPFLVSHFQLGGAGARATKDGLSTTGFPSGVGGVPAEIIESLSPLMQHHRELRVDSGGAGEFRGGLGQATEMRNLSGRPWEISGMADRIQYPGLGLEGGQPGARGEMLVDREAVPAKTLRGLSPEARVELNLPGGGGYGSPTNRPAERVLDDVVKGYVSIEAAEREYGVVVRYVGSEDRLVRLPQHYVLDEEATTWLRGRRSM